MAAGLGEDAAEAEAALSELAAELRFRFGGKRVRGEEAADALSPAVRAALNRWAPLAVEHELSIVVSDDGDHLLVGADEKVLRQALEHMDEVYGDMTAVLPLCGDRRPRAVVGFLFDREGFQSDAWRALLAQLAEERVLDRPAVEALERHPNGLLMRSEGLFLQPTDDLGGDAAAGDDEFRLANEVVNKLTQCLLMMRVGPVPENIRWGLGFAAEYRISESVYMFGSSGFVSTEDHFDWDGKARRVLESRQESAGEIVLSEYVLDSAAAGTAQPPQIVSWACLEHLLRKEPEALRTLLVELAECHAEADRHGLATEFRGDDEGTRAILARRVDTIDPRDVMKTLRSL